LSPLSSCHLLPLTPAASIAGCDDAPELAALDIEHARAQPGFDVARFGAGGDDGGQHGVVTIVEQLEELFLGPGRRAFGAQVI